MAIGLPLSLTTVLIPTTVLVRPASALTHFAHESCQLVGDGDLYGIGVRLGYYLSFFATAIALASDNPRAAADIAKSVFIVSLSVMVVLVRDTVDDGSLASFEWYLVGHLVYPLLMSSSLACGRYGHLVALGCLWMTAGVAGTLTSWPFFFLADQGHYRNCEVKAFLFVPFDFFNDHFVDFTKAFSVFSTIVSFVYLATGVVVVLAICTDPAHDGERKSRLVPLIETYYNALPGYQLALLQLIVGVPLFASLEMMIEINRLDLSGVTLASTSQLIPFLAGLFGFLSTVWTIVHHWRAQLHARHNAEPPDATDDQEPEGRPSDPLLPGCSGPSSVASARSSNDEDAVELSVLEEGVRGFQQDPRPEGDLGAGRPFVGSYSN